MTTADLYGNKLTQNNEPSTVQWYELINTFATKCHLYFATGRSNLSNCRKN